MKVFRSRTAIALATAAMLSMVASPAMARGWHGHRHHRDRVDAGDVFAGLLIVGGIAAIAAAASKSNREKRERENRYPDRDARDGGEYPEYNRAPAGDDEAAQGRSYAGGFRNEGSMDGAVDICVNKLERADRQIESVQSVSRETDGWRVDGRIAGGRDFSCTVDRDGQVTRATVDGSPIS